MLSCTLLQSKGTICPFKYVSWLTQSLGLHLILQSFQFFHQPITNFALAPIVAENSGKMAAVIVDSWYAQKSVTLYQENIVTVALKILSPISTGFVQPLFFASFSNGKIL